MLKDVERVNIKILWTNNALLFVMSFIPFTTGWVGKYPFAAAPLFLYFFDMFLASVAFHLMAYFITKENGRKFSLDIRGTSSLVGYLLAALFGGLMPIAAYILVAGITFWWLIPMKNEKAGKDVNQ